MSTFYGLGEPDAYDLWSAPAPPPHRGPPKSHKPRTSRREREREHRSAREARASYYDDDDYEDQRPSSGRERHRREYSNRKDSDLDPKSSNTPLPRIPTTALAGISYQIGSRITRGPLVYISEIKGHLRLLRAFAEMREEVESAVVGVARTEARKDGRRHDETKDGEEREWPNEKEKLKEKMAQEEEKPNPREESKQKGKETESSTPSSTITDKEKRWGWFVGVAVERFDVWCRSLKNRDTEKVVHHVMPPLDVLMVWHTYLLNPRWFAEDTILRPPVAILRKLESQFTHCLRNGFFDLLTSSPFPERRSLFERRTGLKFEYSVDGRSALATRSIECPNPRCGLVFDVPLMTEKATGFLQSSFLATCPNYFTNSCRMDNIKRSHLSARKLMKDLAERGVDCLPGTALDQKLNPTSSPISTLTLPPALSAFAEPYSSPPSTYPARLKTQAKDFAMKMQRKTPYESLYISDQELAVAFSDTVGEDMERWRWVLGPPCPLLSKILTAYSSDKIYSLDLASAVLRQASFIEKMKAMRWTSPGFFGDGTPELKEREDESGDEDERVVERRSGDVEGQGQGQGDIPLRHAQARYHAFLDLMSSTPETFNVPTLDIDLVWHTHQLMHNEYGWACGKYVGRFVDHDDKVEGLRLSSSFDGTAQAWKKRFGVPYTYCGCPESKAAASESKRERLSKALGGVGSSTSADRSGTSKTPADSTTKSPKTQTRTLIDSTTLVPPLDTPELLASTHPSDHNAVFFLKGGRKPHCAAVERYQNLKRDKDRSAAAAASSSFASSANASASRNMSDDSVGRPKTQTGRGENRVWQNQPHEYESSHHLSTSEYHQEREWQKANGFDFEPGYGFPYHAFLVPIPLFVSNANGDGRNRNGGGNGCVATDGKTVNFVGSGCGGQCGSGCVSGRCAGAGGGKGACGAAGGCASGSGGSGWSHGTDDHGRRDGGDHALLAESFGEQIGGIIGDSVNASGSGCGGGGCGGGCGG